jgi:Na+:H+ antiporter
MDMIHLLYLAITLSAILAYLNHAYIRIPSTIAIMSGSLLISLAIIAIDKVSLSPLEAHAIDILQKLDFHKLLMEGMLNFLLFAGALNVDIYHLTTRKWEITTLATLSTITSMFLIASAIYYLLIILNLPIPYLYCLLFGALISPTDPIAVLSIFKQVNAKESLNVTVTGESLFNDGVGIVLFITLSQVAFSTTEFSWSAALLLFFQQAVGGIIYGVLLGLAGYQLIKKLSDEKVEILITLAMTTGGYILAEKLGTSGPLAMVTAGIFIGNHGKIFGMRKESRENLDKFWELVDEILNAILFLLIGFELLLTRHDSRYLLAGLAVIPIVLLVRYCVVGIPMSIFKRYKRYVPHFINILAWGGLRGGLAVALALSMPDSQYREVILIMTYCVVVFSIIVQGLTIKPLVRLSQRREESEKA